MDWRFKSFAFRVLSSIPFGDQLHFLAQRHLLHSFPRPRARLDALWEKAVQCVDAFSAYAPSTPLSEATFLEIGAGRDLSVPIALRLMGVGHVTSIDVAPLAKLDLIRHSIAHMAAKAGVPPMNVDSWRDVEAFGIAYRAPADLRTLNLVEGSVDCICSNEVLEHLEPGTLHEIAAATRRLLKYGGISVHAIDYSDHYARSDTSIDRFNFLTFEERAWRKHNSSFQYVNRLRHSDYVEIFRSNGLRVLSEIATACVPTKTTRSRIASCFKAYSDVDLFAINGRLILGKPHADGAST